MTMKSKTLPTRQTLQPTGFSLVELMVVILISLLITLGLLITFVGMSKSDRELTKNEQSTGKRANRASDH
jgi:prepilin-type N-terminal cleavage/methylation domain-containing protein